MPQQAAHAMCTQCTEVKVTEAGMAAQKAQDGRSRLKRVTLIGDHHQLPPVVKNMAFQRYSHLDQSLFTRFVRLGSPFIQLNAQVSRAWSGNQKSRFTSFCCSMLVVVPTAISCACAPPCQRLSQYGHDLNARQGRVYCHTGFKMHVCTVDVSPASD